VAPGPTVVAAVVPRVVVVAADAGAERRIAPPANA
jgi:hypothetical protein